MLSNAYRTLANGGRWSPDCHRRRSLSAHGGERFSGIPLTHFCIPFLETFVSYPAIDCCRATTTMDGAIACVCVNTMPPARVSVRGVANLDLFVRPGTSSEQREAILLRWHR